MRVRSLVGVLLLPATFLPAAATAAETTTTTAETATATADTAATAAEATGRRTLSVADAAVEEREGTVAVAITMSQPANRVVTVEATTSDGTRLYRAVTTTQWSTRSGRPSPRTGARRSSS